MAITKFRIEREVLANAMKKVQGITGRKSNLHITEGVLINAGEGRITLTATDLETGFDGDYPAEVEAEGPLVLNARMLNEILKDFPYEDILFEEVEKQWIEISNDGIKYIIVGMDPDDFPVSPKLGDVSFAEIDADTFKGMVAKTVFITGDSDDRRAHIKGMLFEAVDGGVRLVSTDGSRLAMAEGECKGVFHDTGIIIPKKGLIEMVKAMVPGTVRIGVAGNHFIASQTGETFVTLLLEGDFPKAESIMQKHDVPDVRAERKELLRMLKRMTILTSDMCKGVSLRFEEGSLSASISNPSMGEAKEAISVSYSGKTVDATFNPRYIVDALNVMGDDNAVLSVIDAKRHCLLTGCTGKGYLNVIMPINTD